MKSADEHTFFVSCILLCFAAVFGCRKEPPPQVPPPEVAVAKPLRKTVRPYYDFTGNTRAIESVDIQARVTGFLEKQHFKDAADVDEGNILFTIEQEEFKANVDRTKALLESQKATLARAEADLKRVEMAVKSGAVSEQEVDLRRADRDIAKAAVKEAQAALERAELELSYTTVRSPISGRASRSYVDIGNLVSAAAGTLLTRVVKLNPMYVYSNVSETQVIDFLRTYGGTVKTRRQSPAKLYVGLPGEEEFLAEGIVDYVDNTVDPETGTLEIRGNVENSSGLLIPQMFVRLRIPGPEEYDALLVKEEAIGTDLGGKYLLVVGDNNIVDRRYIKLGQLYEGLRDIEEGLEPGERYIVEGLQRARPGLPVTPKETKTTPPAGAMPENATMTSDG